MASPLLIVGLGFALFGIGAQEAPPNAPPAATAKKRAVSKLDGQQEGQKTAQDSADSPKVSPCAQCPNCCVVKQPQTKTKEEQAKSDSLDFLYRTYMWATIVGVVGAWVGIVILWCQTRAATRSANAAKASADALIINERPWVLPDGVVPENLWWEIVGKFDTGGQPRAVLQFKNYGNTPAWIVQSTAFLKICTDQILEQSLDYGHPPMYTNPRLVPPGGAPFTIEIHLDGERRLNPDELNILRSGEAYLILYGFIKYRDVFFEQIRQERETWFCLRASGLKGPYGEVIGGRLEYYGPKGANHHT